MKSYIDIYDSNRNILKMEVVLKFNLDGYNDNYLIYKELNEDKYYIAKYNGENIVNLNTNLSINEIKLSEKILEGVLKNETKCE